MRRRESSGGIAAAPPSAHTIIRSRGSRLARRRRRSCATSDYGGRLGADVAAHVYRNLDEIFAGEYEGMTYENDQEDEARSRRGCARWTRSCRYPRGESYFDILSRLDPLVHEMESYRERLLIVSHQAVLRVLYAYLMGKPRSTAPKIEIPLHTVMKITYDGWSPPKEERFHLGPEPLPVQTDPRRGAGWAAEPVSCPAAGGVVVWEDGSRDITTEESSASTIRRRRR